MLAKPPVRKLARDLGIDLTAITGTGPGGTITRADIEGAAASVPAPSLAAAPAFDPATREQRIPIKGIRKHTAIAVTTSAFTAPHVTEFMTIDATESMLLLERMSGSRELRDVRLTPLVLVARALILAVRRNPMVNATWDEAAQEIVVKDYVNLGIAAATPRGLIVPNIKDAGRLSLRELADALTALVETARSGKTTPADMRAAPSRSPTSACSASTPARRSSRPARRRSSRSGHPRHAVGARGPDRGTTGDAARPVLRPSRRRRRAGQPLPR